MCISGRERFFFLGDELFFCAKPQVEDIKIRLVIPLLKHLRLGRKHLPLAPFANCASDLSSNPRKNSDVRRRLSRKSVCMDGCYHFGVVIPDRIFVMLNLFFISTNHSMGQVRQLDKRMNDAGLLCLMVSDPLAMNMSNTLGYLRGELKDAEKTSSPKGKKRVSFGKRVLEIGFIKKILLAVYQYLRQR
jgi:hypothetical protein